MTGTTTACDVWSVGCTIIELLEGKPPYFDLPQVRRYRALHTLISTSLFNGCDCCFCATKRSFNVVGIMLGIPRDKIGPPAAAVDWTKNVVAALSRDTSGSK